MKSIGFSTGALALGDFRSALTVMWGQPINAVELSALRKDELVPLVAAFESLDLTQYDYVSVHAPSYFEAEEEPEIADLLRECIRRNWPVILHPDAIHSPKCWTPFGELLYLENMDKRKPIGRTASELEKVFEYFPKASLCFDIGHACQVDSSMMEAQKILTTFGSRVRQLHVSEVNADSIHERLSVVTTRSFAKVAHLIPQQAPVILETPVDSLELLDEVKHVKDALCPRDLAFV